MYPEPDGTTGYTITEHASALLWTRLDRLAAFLIDSAEGQWNSLRSLLDGRRLAQRSYIEYLVTPRGDVKGHISELLRASIISLNGKYVPAISFFCENVKRRKEGERRARELLSEGRSEKEAREALQVEFGAARTTAIGWIKKAGEPCSDDIPQKGD
jgi:hypothetical protein